MVHIKDELDKTGHELIELRKTKDEHIIIIENLKVKCPFTCNIWSTDHDMKTVIVFTT